MGGMWPQTKDINSCEKLEEARNGLSLRTSRGSIALLTP